MSDQPQPVVVAPIPPDVLAQLGLPPTFMPAPASWTLAHLKTTTPGAAPGVLVLILDGASGRFAVALPDEAARQLADQITEHVSGLQVARTLDTPNGSFRKP